jgi:hypothetical protein
MMFHNARSEDKMAKKISVVLFILAILTASTGVVFADACDPVDQACNTATGSITFTSDGLHVLANAFNLGSQALTGQDVTIQLVNTTNTATGYPEWTASDETGSGDGWNVTIESQPFRKASGRDWQDPVSYFGVRLTNADIALYDTVTSPADANESGMPVADPEFAADFVPMSTLSAQRLLYAQAFNTIGYGMGTYHFYPDFQLYVPAETYSGTYTALVTIKIISGPGT